MPSYMYAVKEHHLDKQKKYTDKVLSSKTKERERERETTSAKEQKKHRTVDKESPSTCCTVRATRKREYIGTYRDI